MHGVGAHAQLNGTDPPHAVRAFMDYVGRAPMLAFHAPFDRAFLARVTKHYVNQPFDNPWLDLAELAPALEPKLNAGRSMSGLATTRYRSRYGTAPHPMPLRPHC